MARGKQPRAQAGKKPNLLLLTDAKKPSTARLIAYARVSSEDQNLAVQLSLLRAEKPDDLFIEDKISAVSAKRPAYNLMRKFLERGDTVVIYAFNRLSRDLKTTLTIIDELEAEGVKIRSTTEPHIDPFTTNGRLLVSVTGAVDENERRRIIDRTRDGMAELKRQGMYLGRKPGHAKIAAMKFDRQTMTAAAVASKHKVQIETVNQFAPRRAA